MQFSSSNTVDSRVVELRFDNSQFESNAKTSLSTLDRLKKSLDFSKHKTTFVDIGNGLRSISIAPLAAGLDGVTAKFSALEIMGKRALEGLTDDIYRTSKAFLESVTIKQVEQGWGKYAEKTSAVQTIMAATAKDFNDTAEQMEYVNTQLDKLNWFTDETSYNFLEMVNSIGKFTSNNIELDKSVTAMEGISNWAAISGANAQMATHAMYNLSQAIATGSVKLMDWKSIENANMATAEFKQTAIETAAAMGTLKKVSDNEWETLDGKAKVSVANFNEGLQKGWFTSEVLLDTLQKYGAFTDKLSESLDQLGDDMYASKLLGFIDEYKEGTLNLEEAADEAGVSADKLKEILTVLGSDEYEFGRKAFRAAQEAKTFEEAIDSVKDAVSTGWMNTFEIMFGDYLQAKTLWTGLAENLYTIFAEGGNARNKLLKEAFNKEETINQADWDKLSKAGLANPLFIKAIKNAAKSHSDTAKKIKDDQEWLTYALREGVITAGDFQTAWGKAFGGTKKVNNELADAIKKARDSDKEFDALLETMNKFGASDLEGIEWGNHIYDANREAEESVDKVLKKLGLEQSSGEEVVEVLKSMGLFGGIANEEIAHLSDEELRSIGFTDQMIDAYKIAIAGGEDALSVRDAIMTANMSTGELWFDTLAQGMDAVVELFEAAQEEWENIFPPATVDTVRAVVLTLHDAVVHFKDFVETNKALRASFRGLFAAIDIVRMVATSLGKGAFQVLRALMEGLGLDIGGIVTKISDFVIKAREWLKSSQLIQKGINLVSTVANLGGKQLRLWFDQFKNIPGLSKHFESFKTGFKNAFQNLPTFIDGLTDRFKEFGKRVGEMDGIRLDNIGDVFTAFKDTVLSYFMEFPGFQALRSAFEQLKEDVKNKLSEMGIDTEALKKKWEGFKASAVSIFGAIGDAAVAAFGYIVALYDKISKSEFVQTNLARFKNAFSDFPEQFSKFIEGLGEKFDEFKAKVKEIGGFSFDNISEIWTAFSDTVGQFFEDFTGFDSVKQAFVDLKNDVKAKLLAMGIDVDGIKDKIIGFVDDVKAAFENFSLPDAFQSIVDFFIGNKDDMAKGGEKISGAMDKLAEASENLVEKSADLPEWLKSMVKLALGIALIVAAFKMLNIAKKFVSGYLDSVTALKKAMTRELNARVVLEVAIALGILAASVVALANVPEGRLLPAVAAIAALAGVLFLLSLAAKKLNKDAKLKDAGLGLAAIGASILMLALAVKLLESVDVENIPKVAKLLLALSAALLLMSLGLKKIDGSGGVGKSILAMSLSLIVLIGVIKLLDSITIENPKKVALGVIALLGILGVMFLEARLAGKNSEHVGANILAMAAALGIMVGALFVLSLLDQKKLLKCVLVLGALSLCLGAMMLMGKGLTAGSAASILMIGIVLVAVTAALGALTMMDQDKMMQATLCLGGLILVLGVFMKLAESKSGTAGSIGKVLQLVVLAGVIYILGEAIVKIASIGDVSMIETVTSGLLKAMLGLVAIAGVCAILGKLGLASLAGVAILSALLLALMGITGLLGEYAGNGVMQLLIRSGEGLKKFSEGISSVADSLSKIPSAETGVDGIEALKTLMVSIGTIADGELMDKLATVFLGMPPLERFKQQMPQLVDALQAYNDALDRATIDYGTVEKSTNAIALLSSVCSEQIPGNGLFSWITGKGSSKIGKFGEQLVPLAKGLSAYSNAINETDFNEEKQEASKKLIEMLSDLCNDSIPAGGVIGWLKGNGSKISDFASQLPGLARALSAYTRVINTTDFNAEKRDASVALAGMLASLASEKIQDGGLIGMITGNDTKITDFAAQLPGLARSLKAYAICIGDGEFTQDKIDASVNLAGMLAALSSEAIQDGGLIGWLTGNDTKITDFAKQLPGLARSLKAYAICVGSGEFSGDKIDASVNLITMLGVLAADVIPDGGLIGMLTGEGSKITDFAAQLPGLARALKEYAAEVDVATFNPVKLMASGVLITMLGQIASTSIPSNGLFDRLLSGSDTNIEAFGKQLPQLGEGIKGFADKTSGLDAKGANQAISVIRRLGTVTGTIVDLGVNLGEGEFNTFSDRLDGLALTLGRFTQDGNIQNPELLSSVATAATDLLNAVQTVDKIKTSEGDVANETMVDTFTSNIGKLAKAIEDLADLDTSGADKLKSAVDTISSSDVQGALKKTENTPEIDTEAASKSASAEGANVIASATEGVMSAASSMSDAVANVAGDAANAISGAADAFGQKALELVDAMAAAVEGATAFATSLQNMVSEAADSISIDGIIHAGENFVLGFAQGIFNRQAEAIARATALARATMNAVNQTIGAHSPARELIKSGKWFDMGFALGIKRNAYMSEEASEELGTRTMDAMQGAINGITDILSSDIDAQPVIRPVFDLSDIRNGAGTISSILDGIGSEPIVSNLNAISDNVAASRTRATSDDILGALTALQGFDRSGDTYNINGVTYDDGSNITDAVRTLVRAVVVGGRA